MALRETPCSDVSDLSTSDMNFVSLDHDLDPSLSRNGRPRVLLPSQSGGQDGYPIHWIEAVILDRRLSTERKLRDLHAKLANRLDKEPYGPCNLAHITCKTCRVVTAVFVPASVTEVFWKMTSTMGQAPKDGCKRVSCVCEECHEVQPDGSKRKKAKKAGKSKKSKKSRKTKQNSSAPVMEVELSQSEIDKIRRTYNARYPDMPKAEREFEKQGALKRARVAKNEAQQRQAAAKEARVANEKAQQKKPELQALRGVGKDAKKARAEGKRARKKQGAKVSGANAKVSLPESPLLDFLEQIARDLPARAHSAIMTSIGTAVTSGEIRPRWSLDGVAHRAMSEQEETEGLAPLYRRIDLPYPVGASAAADGTVTRGEGA